MRTRTIAPVACSLLLCLGLLGACGDDDGGQNDAAVDSATDAWVGGEFTVVVLDYGLSEDTGTPLSGATVALDPPFDDRVELTTDTAGEVRFDAATIDWSVGTASVTAHKAGYTIQSRVNLTEAALQAADGRLELALFERVVDSTDATALLTGEATGMADPDNKLLVMPWLSDSLWWQEVGSDFELSVPRNTAFELFVLEFQYPSTYTLSDRGFGQHLLNMHVYDVAAIGDATEHMRVDLGDEAVAFHEAHGTWTFPTGADTAWMDDSFLQAWVQDTATDRSIGWIERSDLNAAQTAMEFHLKWRERADFDPQVAYRLSGGGGMSHVIVDGYPAGGDTTLDFVAFPTWTEPSSLSAPRSLYTPFTWDVNNTGVHVWLALFKGEELLWFVEAGDDATGATLPRPPSSLDYEGELQGVALKAELRVGHYQPDSHYFERFAVSHRVTQLIP